MPKLSFVVLFAVLAVGSSTHAADLSGDWEIQSMGGDRKVAVKQKGQKLIAHRVMWPVFEGEKYKLEHLYRGKLKGTKITGQLLVKEDELPDYEVLRDFTGSLEAGRFIIDGMPMKRISGSSKTKPPEVKPTPKRASPPPGTAKAGPPKPPTPPTTPAAPEDESASLFSSIMGGPGGGNLFNISNNVKIPDASKELIDEGDALFKKGRYRLAVKKYENAETASPGVKPALLHKLGVCHLRLEQYPKAEKYLRRAMRFDPDNVDIRRAYRRAKGRG